MPRIAAHTSRRIGERNAGIGRSPYAVAPQVGSDSGAIRDRADARKAPRVVIVAAIVTRSAVFA